MTYKITISLEELIQYARKSFYEDTGLTIESALIGTNPDLTENDKYNYTLAGITIPPVVIISAARTVKNKSNA